MEFEEMEPIFGELKAEWSVGAPKTAALKPFLFLVGGLLNSPDVLRISVTDFHSNTWESRKSKSQLEDMRDSIGIGGSWSDFVEYVIASLKSEDVKLVMEGESKSGGAAKAKLVAQKAKGMPRIIITLAKLVNADANEAMANLSLELHEAYKKMHLSLVNEERRCCQLTKTLSDEQEKNDTLQRHIDTMTFSKKQKFQNSIDKAGLDNGSLVQQSSPDKQAAPVAASTKATKRVVPTHRRAKVRGAFLQESDDDA
ncbi:OLC1v1008438C1 [Oldenlandia corymbosa var. corymbosa]|uniref:OLC1v1008438C1 n=1 Tax=Oldenlandia corymbosa var. corymbosa TaxID=529605 RepID=A0AAV1DP33_OLDCO|nr:OLC1v1008438C1 [Oldenlandia corymbosa var. corymbosa]